MRRDKPVVIADISASDLLQYPQEAKAEGIAAIFSVPIKFARRTIGELRIYHHERWDISERDLDSLMVLGIELNRILDLDILL